MKRLVVTLAVVAGLLCGCASTPPDYPRSSSSVPQESTQSSSPAPQESTQSSAPAPQESTQSSAPAPQESTPVGNNTEPVGIPGSNWYDVAAGLERYGMTDHPLQAMPADMLDAGRHSVESYNKIPEVGVAVSYTLFLDSKLQVIDSDFMATLCPPGATDQQEQFVASASNYLGYCASMPYDTADPAASMAWVQEAVSAGEATATMTCGDATYTVTTAYSDGLAVGYDLYIQVTGDD